MSENIHKPPHYLVYFEPPLEISQKIEELNQLISDTYDNSYNSLVQGVWRSHLMVYLSPMPKENEADIISQVSTVAKDINPMEITLDIFTSDNSGYIFVDISKNDYQQLKEIRETLIESLIPFRDEIIKQKYLDRWDSFTEMEKVRIKTTGIPYEYQPHMTVAKVDAENASDSIDIIADHDLTGVTFIANELKVLRFHQGTNSVLESFTL